MFDWSDLDQVGDVIWGNHSDDGDHIVPYPKCNEESLLYSIGDQNKKQRIDQAGNVIRLAEQTSGANNYFSDCTHRHKSGINQNEEQFATRLGMDKWPELASLNAAPTKGYYDENNGDPMDATLLNTSTETSNMSEVRVQLDEAHEPFGTAPEYKENDGLLDYEWTSFGKFDDFDGVFGDSGFVFDHESVGGRDKFLPVYSDLNSSCVPSIPMLDILPMTDYQSVNACSSYEYGEHPDGKSKALDMAVEHPVQIDEQMACQSHLLWGCHGKFNEMEKEDVQQKHFLKNAEERSNSKFSQNSINTPHNFNKPCPHDENYAEMFPAQKMHPSLETNFHCPTIGQQREFHGSKSMGLPYDSNMLPLSGYGKPAYAYPNITMRPCIHTDGEKAKFSPLGHEGPTDMLNNLEIINKASDVSKPPPMTPQEKIEKLRRRQQMQAMLAIQQQKLQFCHHTNGIENIIHESSHRNQSPGASASTLAVDEDPMKFLLADPGMLDHGNCQSIVYDKNPAENIYHQLQDTLGKLDMRVRISIRDSLFRLARSATERQHASDKTSGNSTNRYDEEVAACEGDNQHERYVKLMDTETSTNPIDRSVVYLLFHHSSETSKEEAFHSPVSYNPCNS